MIDLDIVGHPLFQLNLMIFLTWPSPVASHLTINPVFHAAGYALPFIERDIVVPNGSYRALRTQGHHVNKIVQPDLLLEHSAAKVFLPIECKRSGSSADPGQAMALLTLNGTELKPIIGKPPEEEWATIIAYLSVENNGTYLLGELSRLAGVLAGTGVAPANGASLELLYRADGIYLASVPHSASLPDLDLSRPTRVLALDPDEDPRPFYVIPYLADHGAEADPVAEQCFRESLRSSVLVLFGQLDDEPHEFELDSVITKGIAAWPIWNSADRRKQIRGYVRKFIRETFADLNKKLDIECRIDNQKIKLPAVTPEVALAVRDYMANAGFRHRTLDLSGPIQGSFGFDNMPSPED
ncbi:MAG: hypothetical protein M3Z04_12645 [Chloroflexota bacterium]|nr:hypothetical protein [Chloroflexota bacterium]